MLTQEIIDFVKSNLGKEVTFDQDCNINNPAFIVGYSWNCIIVGFENDEGWYCDMLTTHDTVFIIKDKDIKSYWFIGKEDIITIK